MWYSDAGFNVISEPAMTKSHAVARATPPAAALPLTAAMAHYMYTAFEGVGTPPNTETSKLRCSSVNTASSTRVVLEARFGGISIKVKYNCCCTSYITSSTCACRSTKPKRLGNCYAREASPSGWTRRRGISCPCCVMVVSTLQICAVEAWHSIVAAV